MSRLFYLCLVKFDLFSLRGFILCFMKIYQYKNISSLKIKAISGRIYFFIVFYSDDGYSTLAFVDCKGKQSHFQFKIPIQRSMYCRPSSLEMYVPIKKHLFLFIRLFPSMIDFQMLFLLWIKMFCRLNPIKQIARRFQFNSRFGTYRIVQLWTWKLLPTKDARRLLEVCSLYS